MKKIKIFQKTQKRRFSLTKNTTLLETPLLTSFQPSPNPHIGNYIISKKFQKIAKSLKPENSKTQKTPKNKIIIQDLLNLSNPKNPLENPNKPSKPLKINKNKKNQKITEIHKTTAFLLASGINPKKTSIFLQSKIPMISEMHWITNSLTPLHYLHDIKSYTQTKTKNSKVAHFLQPSLKTADLLVFNPKKVVFGQNQNEFLKFADFSYKKINELLDNKILQMPEIEEIEIFRQLQDFRKMSRFGFSEKGQICLFDDLEEIGNKIMKAKTDSIFEVTNHKSRKEVFNLFLIFSNFVDFSLEESFKKFENKNLLEFKEEFVRVLTEDIGPFQERFFGFLEDLEGLERVLEEGMEESLEMAYLNLNVFKRNLFLENEFGEFK